MKTDSELFDEALVDLTNKCIKAKKIRTWQTIIVYVQIILVFAQLFILKIGQDNNVNTTLYCSLIMLVVVILFIVHRVLNRKIEKNIEI